MNTLVVGKPSKEEVTQYLQHPDLFKRITEDEFSKRIEGEKENSKAIFLFTCISRVKNTSQAANNLLINADSSAGKDFVSKAIVDIFPDKNVQSLRRATPKLFDYWQPVETWNGMICRLTDIPNALLNGAAFRTFLSDGDEKTVLLSKDKDGAVVPVEYQGRGKPVLIATTAEGNPNHEALNRFNIIPLDDSVEQTKAITRRKLKKAAGSLTADEHYSPVALEAMKKLKQVPVLIPFAEQLENHMPTVTRARRDVDRILNLIRASTALHQFQRKQDSEGMYLATGEDYLIARNALLRIQTGHAVSLTRSLKLTMELIGKWHEVKGTDVSFTVPQLRATGAFVSEKMFYTNMDKLLERGLIELNMESREGSFKPVEAYKSRQLKMESLMLPKFTELGEKLSITSDTSTHSIDSDASTGSDTFEKSPTTKQTQFKGLKASEATEANERKKRVYNREFYPMDEFKALPAAEKTVMQKALEKGDYYYFKDGLKRKGSESTKTFNSQKFEQDAGLKGKKPPTYEEVVAQSELKKKARDTKDTAAAVSSMS